jgi:hypothetical protein
MDYHESESFDEPSFSRRNRHYASSSSSSSSTWTTLLASWLDLLTGPTFGIFVAVMVVIVMQYKRTLYNLYDHWQQTWQEDGWQGIVDMLFRQKEIMRAYYQMACEFVRSWRHPQRTGTGLSLLRTTSSAVPPPLVLPEEEEEQVLATNGKHHHHRLYKDRKRRLSSATATNSNGDHLQNSSSSLSPELDPSLSLRQKKNGVVCRQPNSRHDPQQQQQPEIEPAFLNEQDYPPGWLVYHPVLGVVPKEQADQYDKSSHSRQGGMPLSSSMMIAASSG